MSLSQADSALILDELAEAAPDVAFLDAGPEAQPFALGQDGVRPAERLTGLERMGEKVARAFKDAIEPFARARAQVPPPTIETLSFAEWTRDLPAFSSLSHYRMRPLKGGILVAIEADFIAALVESFYGGSGAPKPHKGADFTASEELLLKRLRDKLVAILSDHWNQVTPVELSFAVHETNVAHIGFVRADEPVVVQRFGVSAGAIHTAIRIVYPLASIRPIEARMASKVHDDEEHDGNDAWRRRMAEALAHVRLPVRSVLARPEISVAQLLALKVGDVIPIQLAPRTPLLAGQRHIAEGMIGEQDGRAAMMIEHVGNG
jgi:flagellar motor switch protein FliM